MIIKKRIDELNIELPPFNKAAANYSPAVKSGNLIYTAGQTPKYKGVLQYKGALNDLNYSEGIKAAELCVLNCLSIIQEYANGLDNIEQIVKVSGFINADPDFTKHAIVLDGATNLLVKVFGDKGRPARSAVGMSSLPGNAMIEIEMVVELKS